jgi:hypothetical protein
MQTKSIISRISVIIAVLVLCVPFLFSQERIGKEIHEMYSVNSDTKLQIENKYGNIDIQNWDKKNIEVTVQIKLFDVDNKKAQELLSMININKSTDGNTIIFKTELDDNFSKGLNHFNDGDRKFEIDYVVNMPANIPLNLSNKYGNVFINKLTSLSIIDVKYGNLKANNIASVELDSLTEINLGYSEANIESCSWLKINIKYSKIEITESKALIFESKYSKIFIDRGSSLVTESKYDEYDVGAIANFVTNAEYSNFKFKSIGKKLYIETSYSDVKVGYMPASFELIKIINRYGSYNLGVEDGASYTIKGVAKFGDIIYPNKSKVNRFQETTELKVEGTVGSNSNSNSKVEIDTKYGTVKLIE